MTPIFRDKYTAVRDDLQTGDIILTHSNKPLAKAIQLIDGAYYHHSEIIFRYQNRVMSLGAHPSGVSPDFLSARFKAKKWNDFCILRPKVSKYKINNALGRTLDETEKYIPYDFSLIWKVFLYEEFGYMSEEFGVSEHFICSELTQGFTWNLGFKSYDPERLKRPFFTPHDHKRFMLKDEFILLYNDNY